LILIPVVPAAAAFLAAGFRDEYWYSYSSSDRSEAPKSRDDTGDGDRDMVKRV
jgi:hypothetical protein